MSEQIVTSGCVQRGPTIWASDLAPSAFSLDLAAFCDPSSWPNDGDAVLVSGDVMALDVPTGFGRLAEEVRRRVADGPGFAVVGGFPVATSGWALTTRLYAWLMARFGRLLAQNTAGEELHLVRAGPFGTSGQYGIRSSGELAFHTDQAAALPSVLPAVLGLFALERAESGGRSQVVSGHALINLLLAEDPAFVDVLSQPIPFGRRADGVSDVPTVVAPPIVWMSTGEARLRYNRLFIEVGAEQTGIPLAPDLIAALDAVDDLLEHRDLPVDLLLEPGQALIADNAMVLHRRSAYEDSDAHTRCLVKAWTAPASTGAGLGIASIDEMREGA